MEVVSEFVEHVGDDKCRDQLEGLCDFNPHYNYTLKEGACPERNHNVRKSGLKYTVDP